VGILRGLVDELQMVANCGMQNRAPVCPVAYASVPFPATAIALSRTVAIQIFTVGFVRAVLALSAPLSLFFPWVEFRTAARSGDRFGPSEHECLGVRKDQYPWLTCSRGGNLPIARF